MHSSRRIDETEMISLTVNTVTPHVKAATHIAEFGPASATHVIAALCFFDPDSTARALLELRALHKFLKGYIEEVRVTVSLKFFARLFFVRFRSAIQAIFFFAFDALEIFSSSCLTVNKCVIAVWSRTPRDIS